MAEVLSCWWHVRLSDGTILVLWLPPHEGMARVMVDAAYHPRTVEVLVNIRITRRFKSWSDARFHDAGEPLRPPEWSEVVR